MSTPNVLQISNNGYAQLKFGPDDNTGFILTKEVSDNSLNFWTGPAATAANRFKIGNDGNIGINNWTPTYKLDVYTSRPNDGIRLQYTGGWTALQPNTLTQSAYNLITQAGDAGITFGNSGTSNPSTSYGFVIAPWLNTQSGLRVDKDGNVGICAADTKGYQLAVNGQAIFTKVVVKQYSTWPDYVFDPAYHLPSLRDVHQFIKQNHHLPDIPSADSVEKSGVDIGANQTALLKKIEELTLYIIQQQDRLDRLERLLAEKNK